MAANKLVREPGKYFDCTSMHGKWCTITLVGQDVGYARVGIISSGKDYILFQFRDKKGLVAKAYVKHIVEIKMNERKLKKEQELVVRDWEDGVNPFTYFLDKRCDIHIHKTRLFEASPGFFRAKIMFVGENIIRIRENSKDYNLNQFMICGMMES